MNDEMLEFLVDCWDRIERFDAELACAERVPGKRVAADRLAANLQGIRDGTATLGLPKLHWATGILISVLENGTGDWLGDDAPLLGDAIAHLKDSLTWIEATSGEIPDDDPPCIRKLYEIAFTDEECPSLSDLPEPGAADGDWLEIAPCIQLIEDFAAPEEQHELTGAHAEEEAANELSASEPMLEPGDEARPPTEMTAVVEAIVSLTEQLLHLAAQISDENLATGSRRLLDEAVAFQRTVGNLLVSGVVGGAAGPFEAPPIAERGPSSTTDQHALVPAGGARSDSGTRPVTTQTAPLFAAIDVSAGSIPVKAAEHERPRLRILVIDDSLFFRQLARTALETAGYAVVVAASAPRGLELVRSGDACDVIVCDADLPEVNCGEFAKEVGSVRGDAPVPLIALGAAGTAIDDPRLLRAGFSRVLPKFHARDLIESIEELFAPQFGARGLTG